jgi:hypothetical protein
MEVGVDVQKHDREVTREVFRERSREAAAESPASPHVVRDSTGTRWQVREISGRGVPGARGDACLVFESDAAIRRVWHYPPCWRELPGTELIQLSWGR